MDVEFNVTYITLEGHVEVHRYRYLYFVIMFTVYVLILCSNSTIVSIIVIHRNLHEPMYMFIAALMVNSVLYSTNIYPRLLMDFLSEKQVISYQACLFQNVMYMTLTFSEFSLLAVMSYDRYVSICKPLQYPTIMRRSTVNACLVLSWLLPSCETAVGFFLFSKSKLCRFTLRGIFCNNSIYNLQCVSSSALSVYGVFMLLNVSLLPLVFILFTYTRILIISYQHGREYRRKAAQTCLPHLLVLISFSCLIYFDVVIIRLGLNIPKTTRLILTLQIVSYHSLFNPIIYGLKMKEISKHLKKLLCRSNHTNSTGVRGKG
ncbi:olfactory receptor 13C9-like [Eleginops maclovinus]|uniref:olfactory receptor 13C9-like n=1 Tax=Eleginops maclovinus TaxID=56733 RepID=UPI00307FE720